MDEFDFIRTHLAPIAGEGAENFRDDCAWLPDGEGWMAITTDTSIEGVHFPKGMRGAGASERAVRVALSDLACKGATPIGMTVAMSLPHDLDERWLKGLALGLEEAARALNCPLLGGDTTRHDGRLSITVTAWGRAERKLLRSGARVGDVLWVTGTVGDGWLGLQYRMGQPAVDEPTGADLVDTEEAYLRPHIDFAIGKRIAGFATASADVSDGLLADAENIARASGVGVEIEIQDIPLSAAGQHYAGESNERQVRLATAGDDYTILFTAAVCPEGVAATRVGTITKGEGVRVLDGDGRPMSVDSLGYTH